MDYTNKMKQQREARDDARRKNLSELAANFGSVTALAAKLERSPQQIHNMIKGRKSFGDEITRYIENRLDLPSGWLDTSNQSEALSNVTPANLPSRRVPLLSFVQAGHLTDVGDMCLDEFVYCTNEVSKDAFGLRIEGDSMTPLFNQGDIAIVDPNRCPKPGDYVVARSELESMNEATLKQYYVTSYDEHGREVFELRPLNAMYPPMNSVKHKLRVVGVVVELVKRF